DQRRHETAGGGRECGPVAELERRRLPRTGGRRDPLSRRSIGDGRSPRGGRRDQDALAQARRRRDLLDFERERRGGAAQAGDGLPAAWTALYVEAYGLLLFVIRHPLDLYPGDTN